MQKIYIYILNRNFELTEYEAGERLAALVFFCISWKQSGKNERYLIDERYLIMQLERDSLVVTLIGSAVEKVEAIEHLRQSTSN